MYIQSDRNIPQKLKVDGNLQYGMQCRKVFFVLHDKEQKPYQHCFETNALQKLAYAANSLLVAGRGVDLSWAEGDYLHDV